ncbi:extracellular solute-binding protein, partial [Candidatus Collierbacteria bacterium]|nr:extracellular solute-binding protein [Candidatus Collierbacteria bacterium]
MPNQFPLPTPPEEYIPPPPGEQPVGFTGSIEPTPMGGVPLPSGREESPVPGGYEPPPQPAATLPIRTSPFKIIVPVAIGLVILGVIIFIASRLLSKPQAPKPTTEGAVVTINYWGQWEPPSIMKPVIEAFEQANPGIKVNYQLQSHQDYQDRLKTALTTQNPPDVARIHSTWLPIFISNLVPAPANTVSVTEIQTNFYPVVANSVIVNNQVYGVPLTLDGLVLYLNTNILKQQNVIAPTTWPELKDAAEKLIQTDPVTGKITRAGVALGNTSNISHWPDILSLMLLQGGVNLLNPVAASTVETLTFYTSFAGQGKWDDTLPESVVAFANEKVAMIFAPLWRIPEIQSINPGLTWQ